MKKPAGDHRPDPPSSWVEFNGYRFHPPFKCMCCGKEICARQFAYGRACGICDMGACNPNNKVYDVRYAHPHPEWWSQNGGKLFEDFVKAMQAQEIKEILALEGD